MSGDTGADHPHTDPGDGRVECPTCGKWVHLVIHSCKGRGMQYYRARSAIRVMEGEVRRLLLATHECGHEVQDHILTLDKCEKSVAEVIAPLIAAQTEQQVARMERAARDLYRYWHTFGTHRMAAAKELSDSRDGQWLDGHGRGIAECADDLRNRYLADFGIDIASKGVRVAGPTGDVGADIADGYTPTATDALRRWLFHAGFSIRRRDAGLAALDAFDAALRGDVGCGSPHADWCYDGTCSMCEDPS